jgi:dipeptidyl aminopeptidase/acylaminoacyl peptidase
MDAKESAMSRPLPKRALAVASVALIALVWSAAPPVTAQAPAKRPLTYDVYESWRSIGGTRLSDDGQWLAYALTSQAEDGELVVRNLGTNQEIRHPRGTSPQFTPDAKFVIFTIVPPKSETDDAQDENEGGGEQAAGRGGRGGGQNQNQNRNSVGIMTLPDGKVTTVEQIGSFRLPEESSTWLAMHKGRAGGGGGRGGRGGRAGGGGGRGGGRGEQPAAQAAGQGAGRQGQGRQGEGAQTPPEKRKDPGQDLTIRNLATGQDVVIPEVTEFAWDKSGSWLVYAVSSNDATKDGAFARRMSDGTVRTLQAGKGHYKSFAFDEEAGQLAFLSDKAEYANPVSPYRVYYWKVGDPVAEELVSASTPGVPEGMVVADSAPRFSEDGNRLILSTGPPPDPPADPNAPRPRTINVDLWHYRDPMLQPMQRVRNNQEQNRTYRAVLHLKDKKFVQLATADLPDVNPGADPNRAVASNSLPYRQEVSWDGTYNDVVLVDLKTGARRKVLEHWSGSATMSPGGKYLMYFDERNGDWFTYRIADGSRVNISERIGVDFWREDHDTPDLPGPYGSAGWTENDATVLLYDKYDIWEVRPDGSAPRNLTGGEGRKQQLVFRYRSLDQDQRAIPAGKPMLLSTTNDVTKASGYYRVTHGAATAPEKLMMIDKAVGTPTKAAKADVVVFTQSRFDEFPDLWVSDTSFRESKKVSNANPQQADFVWGKSELIDYINADGKKLRAILTKPENFDPTKKYPLMVYIYEGLTQGLHSYSSPNVGTSINVTRYVSNGYVVLRPDIEYSTGYPGESAEKCVIPAVNTVTAMGFIDPKRIGIQGHSWGGYQITHLITRTDMFAAVQAGASVANMISAYGGIRWGTGMSRAFQYEKTQSRIGAPPWDAPLQFIENSPIFWVEKVHTPYLTIHNDADDAVPWYQAIEFFSALRRLGKEAYFFNYNGEPHGLRNRDNMKHWTVHQDEFFDHYLLGKPKPEWMEKGVPYSERGTRDVSGMFKKQVVTPAPNGRR